MSERKPICQRASPARAAGHTNPISLGKRAVLCCLLLCACAHHGKTQRVVSGHTLEGEYISPDAYASVLHAELLLAQGQYEEALHAYEDASDYAHDSVSLWTRVAALGCRLGASDSERAFARAERIDAHFEPLWRERARCALSQNRPRAALNAARRATALDPLRPEATELVARALSRLGQPQTAERWRHALVLGRELGTGSTQIQATTADPSSRLLDEPGAPHCNGGVEQLDAALRRDDLFTARACAVALHIRPAELALHALELGLPSAAFAQAQLVLSANPLDTDARVAALCSSDLLGQNERFRSLLILPTGSAPLTGLAERQLLRLLARRAQYSDPPTPLATEPPNGETEIVAPTLSD